MKYIFNHFLCAFEVKLMEEKTKMLVAIALTAIICIAGTYMVAGTDSNEAGESIVISGSTTVQPMMVEMQEQFQDYTNMSLSITGGGSSAGVTGVSNGSSNIGMLSRDLKAEETGFDVTIIAKDAVVIIVDKNSGVSNLTIEQVAKIYSGEYTNWNQVGGANLSIKPIIREEGSGTRDCLDTVLGTVPGFNTNKYSTYSTQASTGAMLSNVTMIDGAIGYVNLGSMSSVDTNQLTVATLNGVMSSADTVIDESYGMFRNLILITKGTQSDSVKFFLNWILSIQGQKIVEAQGFVSVR